MDRGPTRRDLAGACLAHALSGLALRSVQIGPLYENPETNEGMEQALPSKGVQVWIDPGNAYDIKGGVPLLPPTPWDPDLPIFYWWKLISCSPMHAGSCSQWNFPIPHTPSYMMPSNRKVSGSVLLGSMPYQSIYHSTNHFFPRSVSQSTWSL